MGVECYDNSRRKINEKENQIAKIEVPSINLITLINSKYIVEEILSFLKKKKALNLIIYNKSLQKYLDINIDNYKKISGKYKIVEKNGKGKEYFYGQLIFKGEYLNGKKNGKGKEYDFYGQLIFKGEYLNGNKIKGKGYEEDNITFILEKDGKGKELYDNGKLRFKGEYLNGKKWNGKGFNNKGEEIFEIKNGKGLVQEYDYKGRIIYEGEYLNGDRWKGKGNEEYYYNDKYIYFEGEYLNGEKFRGKVKEYDKLKNLIFSGV